MATPSRYSRNFYWRFLYGNSAHRRANEIAKNNPDLRHGVYGRTLESNPNVIEIGPDALMSESELANTIAHELNYARDFIKGGKAPEPPAYDSGNALADYINGASCIIQV